jgi:4-aminobutyrate aminotransferase / (S)-3-amino-2-methylpropionate transaminase / 5-aminovalerate transaminase
VTTSTRFIHLATSVPGPLSRELLARKERAVPDAFALHVPVGIVKGSGALVTDLDGNVFIDLAGGIGCLNVGHSHPKVVRAIQESAACYTHTDFSIIPYESYVRLAERLCALAPGDFPKKACFFNSGAEAVENSIKIARKYTGRRGIIALDGAFHGRTYMALALTSKTKPYKQGLGPFAPEVYRVPAPYFYRKPAGMTEAQHVDWCVEALEKAFITQVHPEDCAAVIVEPVQGEGGFIPLHPEYLRAVQAICRKHRVLLIADEVQTGFGRTGCFFASEALGIEPDLIVVGKSVAAGLPLSGVLGRREVMDAPGDNTIGGTYVGNPVACNAANAVLDVMEEEDLCARADQLGMLYTRLFRRMGERLAGAAGGRLFIGEVRGLGAMIGAEFVRDLWTKEPAGEEVNRLLQRCIERGVIAVKCGIYGNVLRVLAPLVITDDQVEEAFGVMEEVALEMAERP